MKPKSLSMKNFTLRLDDTLSRKIERITQYYGLQTDADTIRLLITQEHRKIEKEEKEKVTG
jgi:hypothetical protein